MSVKMTKFNKRMHNLSDMPQEVMAEAYPFLVNKTPIKSGNAQRKTKLINNKSTIVSDYAYADRLDNGSSKQAPKGYTEPTIEYMKKLVKSKSKRI